MKTKKIPAIVMLLAGSVACIITYLNEYNLKDMLVALVWVLILFYFLGVIIELLFEKFEIEKKPEPEVNDGEVVDKTQEVSETLEEGEILGDNSSYSNGTDDNPNL